MAARDSQGLQAIVIVLTLAVIGLGVGLIFVNNAKKKAQAQAKSATDKSNEEHRTSQKLQSEANNYKTWIGNNEADSFETLQKSFNEDMERFGKTFDEGSRYYRTILENLYIENGKLALSEGDAKQQLKSVEERLLAVEQQKEEQITQISEQLKQAGQDAASESTKFNADRDRINGEKDQIVNQLAEQRRKSDQQQASHQVAIKKVNDKLVKLERHVALLRSQQPDKDVFAQPADGRITWVNQRHQKVWIDLGKADFLRPQMNFKIYGSDKNDALSAESKGTIEVVRLMDDHLAEARITSDDFRRPVMPGDKIYSQVWDRGRQVGFAITGEIDFDDNGRSDLDQLKRVIAINNGRVDSMFEEKSGKVTGQMSVDTRYLILGKFPEGARQEGLLKAWHVMTKEADTLGIDTIVLDDFLQLMGWLPGNATVKMGIGARPEDFKAHFKDGIQPLSPNTTSDLFKRRTPPPSY